MKPVLALLSLSFLSLNAFAEARGGIGTGGGNAIRCDDGKLYAWDFINKKLDNLPLAPELTNASTTKEILDRIAARLVDLSPEHGASWNDFRRFNDDLFSPDTDRIWIRSQNPLINIGDEDRTSLPKSCVANATPAFQLYQAVVRSTTDNGVKIRYEYDPNLITDLERTSPLQASFLYVHEWLRDFHSDAKTITLVNQLFHSTPFLHGDIARARAVAAQLGLKFGQRLPVGKYVLKSGLNVLANPVITVEPTADKRSLAYYIAGTIIDKATLHKRQADDYWERDHAANNIQFASGKRVGKARVIKFNKDTGWATLPDNTLAAAVDDSYHNPHELSLMMKFDDDDGVGKCFTAYVTAHVAWPLPNDGDQSRWGDAYQRSDKGTYCLAP